MNTALMILVLVAPLVLALRQLEVSHARSARTPWLAPLGSDPSGDRDARRVADDVRATAQHCPEAVRLVRPSALPARVLGRASRAA